MFSTAMPSKIFVLLMLCCLQLFLGGCAAFHGIKNDPTVSIADIRVKEIKSMEGIFIIKLRVLNPNEVAMDIRGISCDLEINHHHFATGIGDNYQTVPAYGTTMVPIDVYASAMDIISSVTDMLHSMGQQSFAPEKPLPYTLKGKVLVGMHGYTKEIPFVSNGEIALNWLGRLKGLAPLKGLGH